MSLFRPERRGLGATQGVLTDLLALRGMAPRSASLTITPDTAMRHSVVAACVQTIANLSILSLHGYRSVDGREVQVATDPPLIREPSAEIEPLEWRRQVFDAWLRRGTAFGLVARTINGWPSQIELVPAEAVTVTTSTRLAEPTWKVDGVVRTRWERGGDLWVSRGLHTRTGVPVGISPIEMALGAIGLGLAAEDFGASWFFDGAHPSAVLSSEQSIDQATAAVVKQRFIDAVRGRREPAVLGAGLSYQAIQVAADESQFLETLDRNAATVARFFLMPPEEVGASSGNSMTYQNAEARALALLTRTYQPWISRLEAASTRLLPPSLIARADITDLIRVDIATRTRVDGEDIRAGIRNRNEVRASRGLAPIDGGDEFLWPPYRSFPIASDSPGGSP